jgi:hypothetical protein
VAPRNGVRAIGTGFILDVAGAEIEAGHALSRIDQDHGSRSCGKGRSPPHRMILADYLTSAF